MWHYSIHIVSSTFSWCWLSGVMCELLRYFPFNHSSKVALQPQYNRFSVQSTLRTGRIWRSKNCYLNYNWNQMQKQIEKPKADESSLFLLARPSSSVQVADDGAARMNVFHCFLSLAHSTAWRMLLPIFCMSSLTFSVHLFFSLPRVLVPVAMVSTALAGNLELSIRLTRPNHCNLSK